MNDHYNGDGRTVSIGMDDVMPNTKPPSNFDKKKYSFKSGGKKNTQISISRIENEYVDASNFRRKSSKRNVEGVYLKNNLNQNNANQSMNSTVENKHRVLNTQMSMDYNKDVSILQMLDPGTDHETSGLIDDQYEKKMNGADVIPERKQDSLSKRRHLLPG